MKFTPLPLEKQTIMIMGPARGLALVLSRMALEAGARVHRADPGGSEQELNQLVHEVTKNFGQIDAWINCSNSMLSGYVLEGDIDFERKLFEVNFWTPRLATKAAVKALSEKGGVLVNLGSEVAVSSEPLLGIYASSKMALKTFTENLRTELKERDLPVQVCLVRPPPVGSQEADVETATAILKCLEKPQRDIFVGGPAKLSAILDTFFPEVKDILAEQKLRNSETKGGHP